MLLSKHHIHINIYNFNDISFSASSAEMIAFFNRQNATQKISIFFSRISGYGNQIVCLIFPYFPRQIEWILLQMLVVRVWRHEFQFPKFAENVLNKGALTFIFMDAIIRMKWENSGKKRILILNSANTRHFASTWMKESLIAVVIILQKKGFHQINRKNVI